MANFKETLIMMLEVRVQREGVYDRLREEWAGFTFLDDLPSALNIWVVSKTSQM